MGISVTSLQHPNLRCKLHGAMLRATQDSRKGLETRCGLYGVGCADTGKFTVLHNRMTRNDSGAKAFTFLFRGVDITSIVLRALRS